MALPTSKVFKVEFSPKNVTIIQVVLLIFAALGVYCFSLDHSFLMSWDDNQYVVNNPDIRGFTLEHLRAAFTKFYVGNYAPLQIVSYMLDYTLWGLNPAGFIGANILLQTVNGLLFYWLVAKLTTNKRLAFFSSFIFLLHPVQVESVVWISQRKNLLAMFFFLISFHSYVYYRGNDLGKKYLWYGVALLAFMCALLSKSVVVILPIVLVLYDFCLAPRKSRRQLIMDKVPFFAAALLVALITLKSQASGAGGGIVNYPDESAFGIFITMLTVFARYAGMLIWPANLSIYYLTPIKPEVDAAVILSGMLMILFAAGLYFLLRKEKAMFFWATLIPIGILPVSQIIPLSTLMNDRYLYFPILGFAVLLASGALFCCDRLFPRTTWAGTVLICLLLLPLPILSWERSQVWSDSIALWSDAVNKSPDFATYAGMGNALYQAGRIEEAVGMYQQSLGLEPTCEEALRSMGAIYLNLGEYDKALVYITSFVENYPDNAFGQRMLAIANQRLDMNRPK
jgi:protein O-mannosyl-transferase